MNMLSIVLGIAIIGFLGVFSYRNIMSIIDSRKKAKAKKEQQENDASANSSEDKTEDATKTEPKS